MASDFGTILQFIRHGIIRDETYLGINLKPIYMGIFRIVLHGARTAVLESFGVQLVPLIQDNLSFLPANCSLCIMEQVVVKGVFKISRIAFQTLARL